MQGRSFRPLLEGEPPEDWPDAMYYRYWVHDDPIHAAPGALRHPHGRRYKLIHYYGAGLGFRGRRTACFESEWELYDLGDPAELATSPTTRRTAAVGPTSR